MPICSRCSSTLTAADRFCPRCGAPSRPAPDPSEDPTVAAARPAPPPSDPSSLGHGRFEPGTRLGTRYRIVGLLGRGGMGEVYRADDLELGQSVALKFLPERLRRDPEALARLRAEVRLSRQIAHPNVARVYDIAEAEGHVFLTMEYVDGEDLASVLRRMGRPSRDKAVEIARQLCLGLGAAHERGVLHRDLKPSNVMIDGRGRVRVMDFGLAAVAGEAPDEPHLVVGTSAYMAPEQLAAGQVSVQSDLYALGLVLYELFTGRRVHDTTDRDELRRRHEQGVIQTPSSVVDDLDPVAERVVLRCLERDPRLRPASAYAVLRALPGGDPLAAALAAGETPTPELVANAGESGGLAPRVAGALLVLALATMLASTWLAAPHFRPLRRAPALLSFEAAAVLEALGYDHLPGHSAAGFAVRTECASRLGRRHLPADSLAGAGPGAYFFWRRFAPEHLLPVDLHRSVPLLSDPPLSGAGSVVVLLDLDGHLLGLQALPAPDAGLRAARPSAPWAALLAQAAIDTAALAPEAVAWSPPVASDTTAAWTLRPPRPAWGLLHVRAAAYHGRAVYFAIADSLGSATDTIDPPVPDLGWDAAEWIDFGVWAALCAGGIVLARRNLRLGRGDRRGAFRLAAFVFVATALESVVTWNVPENGLQTLLDSLLSDRTLGHALIHGSQMWLAYVAIEPYVRRLWPRMLMSWARLAGGRARDPMVGRDLLIGLALGGAGAVALQLAQRIWAVARLAAPPDLLGGGQLAGIASLGGLGYLIAFYASVTVLDVLEALVTCLLVHLVTRDVRRTFLLAGAITTLWNAAGILGSYTPHALMMSAGFTVTAFVALFRFGLLTALMAVFTAYVLGSAPPVFDAGAWYDGDGMVVLALLGALLAFSAWTALAGRPWVGDVLGEPRPQRS